MKTLIPLVIILVIAIESSVSGGLFIAEQADVLKKDEFLLKEGFSFLKFADIREPGLYEEDPPYSLQGALSRKEILELPVEFRAGLTDNLTIGFSTSYILNLQDMSISGNSGISDGSYVLAAGGLAYMGFIGKYSIIKEGNDIPGFSILLKARFPLGDEDSFGEDRNFKLRLPLGVRGISLGIYELLSKKLDFITVHFNLGYEYCAPYSQKYNSLGVILPQPRTIDPGDRLFYSLACIRNWKKSSFIVELNGVFTRDLRINNISIKNSGMHTLDGIVGIQYRALYNFSINIGAQVTILSSGSNQENNFGPLINLSHRF